MYKYDKYGDSSTCLNGDFDISNKNATIQGFGITGPTGEFAKGLLEATVTTTTNENCTRWIKQNSKTFESANQAIKYGKGYTFAELHDGINNGTLCSWGFLSLKIA